MVGWTNQRRYDHPSPPPSQVPQVHPGPVCRAGLHAGLLPSRVQQHQQATIRLAPSGLPGAGQKVSFMYMYEPGVVQE